MTELTEKQLLEFQELLTWKSSLRMPDGRLFGGTAQQFKHNDPRITAVMEHLDPAGKTILELGSYEGAHTVLLAPLCRKLTALEVRPRNIIHTLVRMFVHGVDNVDLLLKDANDLDSSFGKFDILFHSGVLYHLNNPVEHLFKVSALADDMMLDTHYCTDSTSYARDDITHENKTYKAYRYEEFGWKDPLSGTEKYSRWLHRDALLQLVADAGFTFVEVFREMDTTDAGSPRIVMICRKDKERQTDEGADHRQGEHRSSQAERTAIQQAHLRIAELEAELDCLRDSIREFVRIADNKHPISR